MRICPNCKKILTQEGHFVPPFLGGKSVFTCEPAGLVLPPPTKSITVSDPLEAAALKEQFHEIQQRVEQMRFKVMLAEAQITTHEEIQPTIETYNAWDRMRFLHAELIEVYAQALDDWRELFKSAKEKQKDE